MGLSDRRKEFEAMHPEWGKSGIYQEFLRTVRRFPQQKLFIDEEGFLTYQEASRLVKVLADIFYQYGIRHGSHVALCVEQKRWFVLVSLALYRLGAVKIPTTQKLGKKELLYILNQSDTEYLISQRSFSEAFLDEVKRYTGAFALEAEDGSSRTHILPEIMQAALSAAPESEEVPFDDRAGLAAGEVTDIMYTSGSTAWPKGVMLTNQMLLQSAYANDYNRGFVHGRRIYVPIPLHHIFGYVEGVLGAILAGATLVFTCGHFDAEKALKCMEEHQVHDILLVPSMAVKMMRSPAFAQTDLSSLYAMYCGASICSETVWQEIQDQFRIQEIVTGYGMTELAGATMQNIPGDNISILKRSLGRLMAYRPVEGVGNWIEYKVVDTISHEQLPAGEAGELWCRGALVTPGYYKNDEANARAFSKDGWLMTGDIACFDQNGYLEFIGRCHEQCKVNGENVSLQFLDKIIGECPNVQAVETVGVADAKSGNAVVAFIECTENTPEIQNGIMTYCKNNLTSYQTPKYFVFGSREEWPQTSSLKVQKYQLKQRAERLLQDGSYSLSSLK